ncbi:zinc ribbon domain-containing protein [Plantactinospora sp. KLBMP9567]|uniref:zinc ribbon domain-containing protein n=1 Tax=Plantactinospora sp. KLBMP9567 TaxID=3085900 RepID=UPI00298223FA|nr:zinc ribbon domain-containing protein [Plantactinospora sp. KLBMP9567]MDW5322855.1 zinc ribbon domain-containing protein [Plantactinospora sp. KLBMP9567]
MDFPIVKRATPGRYLLRGLISCGPCDELLIPSFSSSGRRYYGCPRRQCPRPWIPAEQTEQAVWAHVAATYGDAARDVPQDRRQALLTALLARVSIGVRVADLHYQWR